VAPDAGDRSERSQCRRRWPPTRSATAARALHPDGTVGSITPGKLADLAMVERNPLSCDPEELPGLTITQLPSVQTFG
jgi:cytosine/adenosine deaminase-related metal-dependent hydrolase